MPDRPMTDANAPESGAAPRVSVVVPVRNEAGNVAPLIGEIARAMAPLAPFEIVYVNDGSTDETAAELRRLATGVPVPARRRSRGVVRPIGGGAHRRLRRPRARSW